jgi:hypothetical protein
VKRTTAFVFLGFIFCFVASDDSEIGGTGVIPHGMVKKY